MSYSRRVSCFQYLKMKRGLPILGVAGLVAGHTDRLVAFKDPGRPSISMLMERGVLKRCYLVLSLA